MEDFPTRVADFLESLTTRIREMTVDRVARVIKLVTLGLLAFTLVGIAFIFLAVGLFRILEELVFKVCDCSQAMEISYGAVAGLLVLVGALFWSRRTRTKTEDEA